VNKAGRVEARSQHSGQSLDARANQWNRTRSEPNGCSSSIGPSSGGRVAGCGGCGGGADGQARAPLGTVVVGGVGGVGVATYAGAALPPSPVFLRLAEQRRAAKEAEEAAKPKPMHPSEELRKRIERVHVERTQKVTPPPPLDLVLLFLHIMILVGCVRTIQLAKEEGELAATAAVVGTKWDYEVHFGEKWIKGVGARERPRRFVFTHSMHSSSSSSSYCYCYHCCCCYY
jgi:hypothetical protein